mmetsp:Transcript_32208/g.32834  ORF Transcript_32208/g.32834 Transcript_32208/m.32834 type:complete len:537 (+) Transcript_32208:85-1695(+)|eukprot:CAMPEP_0182417046 /NCGR_PEP_ID=MMETSP1167-20130531/1474_1 /TAXON_ID=2988 /ORGANISM="Mallomonas Sp, Strain CCMP3275" /LENGTH=536 /DNA_ID=CAMNT_0024590327 /DNA_START=82 /DNA_END=1692 /DNA_ORIENTATION=+
MSSSKKISSKDDLPINRVLKQREIIENLRHENEILKLDLTQESRESRKAASSGAAMDIARLQDQAAMYVRKIENERKKIDDLDKGIMKYQEKVLEQNARLGGVNASQHNNQMIHKQIKVLESRLDKSLLKFNETLSQNKVLRKKIDDYRRERVVFDGIYKKLERELHEKKKEMAAIIEDSKNAYQARDKRQSDMNAFQKLAEKERAEFEAEFKELSDSIRQQQSMLEQLRLKQFDNTQEEQITALSIHDENESESVNQLGSWVSNKDKATPLSQERIHSYEDALAKIQESTGLTDVNDIVTRFLEAEEQNFSLFNYVNDINSEIERLEHSIADMRNQIEKYRGQGMSTDTQRKKALRDLEEKLSRTEEKAKKYDSRYNRAVNTIKQLKNGIHSIFTRIGAGTSSVEEMLGNQEVTESNMMQYLGIIEQRTSEILQIYAATQSGQVNEPSSGSVQQLPSVTPLEYTSKLSVPLPTDDSGNDDTDSDEDERPLTRQELDKKAVKYNKKGGLLNPLLKSKGMTAEGFDVNNNTSPTKSE